jgi:hypothetical protein
MSVNYALNRQILSKRIYQPDGHRSELFLGTMGYAMLKVMARLECAMKGSYLLHQCRLFITSKRTTIYRLPSF